MTLDFTRQELLTDTQVMRDAIWLKNNLKVPIPTAVLECVKRNVDVFTDFDVIKWLEERNEKCELIDLFKDAEQYEDDEFIMMMRNFLEYCSQTAGLEV